MLFTSVVLPEIFYIVVGTGIVQHAHWTPRSASAAEQPSDVVNVSSIMLELQRAKDNATRASQMQRVNLSRVPVLHCQ